jgi:dsDNA-specific endonuclease/ATPase MutS2
MDPEPTVALNNKEALLSGKEEQEEARILAALSAAVAAQSAPIWQVRILHDRSIFPWRHRMTVN